MYKLLLIFTYSLHSVSGASVQINDPFPETVWNKLDYCDTLGRVASDNIHSIASDGSVSVSWTCVPTTPDYNKLREANKPDPKEKELQEDGSYQ